MIKKMMILAFFAALIAGCATTKNVVDSSTGDWKYLVTDTPDGDASGIFTITKNGDSYTGVISAAGQETPLNDIEIKDDVLTCNFDYMGYTVNVKSKIEGESMSGDMTVDYNGYPFSAQKVK